jgi:hypothetical protein
LSPAQAQWIRRNKGSNSVVDAAGLTSLASPVKSVLNCKTLTSFVHLACLAIASNSDKYVNSQLIVS